MEVDHESFRREGFFFDRNLFRLDLYRLITCFYSSITFAENIEDHDFDSIKVLQSDFEESEITRLLVNIAVTARIMDDRENNVTSGLSCECGELISDLSKPSNTTSLSLREAYNKIIHAKKFNWDVDNLDKEDETLPYPTTRYLTPRMYLYGSKGEREWKATLDIEKFVKLNDSLWNG